MKKHITCILILSLLILCFSAGTFAAAATPGDQNAGITVSDIKYDAKISTPAELKAFRDKVNKGQTSLNAILLKDIDMTRAGNWTPIGINSNAYEGYFNGDGHIISGLTSDVGVGEAGLFGVTNGATICKLEVSGYVHGKTYAGGIVAYADETVIEDCGTYTDILAEGTAAGGIAGYISGNPTAQATSFPYSRITRCYSYSITEADAVGGACGGIAGQVTGGTAIQYCYNGGSFLCANGDAGGIAGRLSDTSTVTCSLNTGKTGSTYQNRGGIAASINNYASVKNSYYLGTELTNGNDASSNKADNDLNTFSNDNKNLFQSPTFVTTLNGNKKSPFVFDQYYSNEGYPMLPLMKNFSFFSDVPAETWYTGPVNWAYENKITSGTSEDVFSPQMQCDRSQMVTFLWNAEGKPEPTITTCPFTDVKPSDWYYKAVLWAYENNITAGTYPGYFSPKVTVTRSQVVKFLWNVAGNPDYSSVKTPFTDLDQKAYYYDAVLWASATKVTAGTTATTFSPLAPCDRSQIVSFLYRYYFYNKL